MPTSNETFLKESLYHETQLIQFARTLAAEFFKELSGTDSEVSKIVFGRLGDVVSLNKPSDFKKLYAIIDEVSEVRSLAYENAYKKMNEALGELGVAEQGFYSGLTTACLPVIYEPAMLASRYLKGIVSSRPFEGSLFKDWVSRNEADDIARITEVIQRGMLNNNAPGAIVKELRGTGPFGKSGVSETSYTRIESLVLTASSFISNEVRREFFMANEAIVDKEKLIVTLDSHTSPICRGLKPLIYPVGKGPQPPLHWRCRTIRVVVFNGKVLGMRPVKPFVKKELVAEFAKNEGYGNITSRDNLPRGSKGKYDAWERKRVRELIGREPASLDYPQFFERLTKYQQEAILGPSRYLLYSKGKLTLDKFVSSSGKPLNLANLANSYPEAFKLAELSITTSNQTPVGVIR